jgi:integrase
MSQHWITKSAEILWNVTNGTISEATLDSLRKYVLNKYTCNYAKRKVFNFTKAFLKYLMKTRLDVRYRAFELFLEQPKVPKERKNITGRIVTREDINRVLCTIAQAREKGEIGYDLARNFKALVLFGAYTGQRSEATVKKLTVKQFRQALSTEKSVIDIQSWQDKIRMQHYCPLHPQVVQAIEPLVNGLSDDKQIFKHLAFERWIRQHKIQLTRSENHFVVGDLRKFAEQHGDIIEWDHSNRAYIMTHGVSGVEWAHYKHPLPEYVYDVYMKHWSDVCFVC